MLAQLLIGPLAVDHEHAAGLDILDHLHAHVDVSGVVAGHEVSLVDVVGAADGLVAETQVLMVTPPVFLESYWKYA